MRNRIRSSASVDAPARVTELCECDVQNSNPDRHENYQIENPRWEFHKIHEQRYQSTRYDNQNGKENSFEPCLFDSEENVKGKNPEECPRREINVTNQILSHCSSAV